MSSFHLEERWRARESGGTDESLHFFGALGYCLVVVPGRIFGGHAGIQHVRFYSWRVTEIVEGKRCEMGLTNPLLGFSRRDFHIRVLGSTTMGIGRERLYVISFLRHERREETDRILFTTSRPLGDIVNTSG